jgi:AraC-like DNA-binding protein
MKQKKARSLMNGSFFYELNHQALRVHYGQNLTFYPHFHNHLEFYASLGGQTRVVVEDKERVLETGDVAVIWPNRVHSYTALGSTSHCIGIVDMSLIHEYAPALIQHDCPDPFLPRERVHPDVMRCLDSLAQPEQLPEPLRRAYLNVLIGRLLEQLPLIERAQPLGHDTLRDLMTFIDAHVTEPLSLERLSRELYLNKYYISKLFAQRIGCSLRTYINAIRVDKACALLSDPSVTMLQIMEACGFESERTFYRAFKAQCGMTPNHYRSLPQKSLRPAISGRPHPDITHGAL